MLDEWSHLLDHSSSILINWHNKKYSYCQNSCRTRHRTFLPLFTKPCRWWGSLCASTIRIAMSAGVRPLAGLTKPNRSKGRSQTDVVKPTSILAGSWSLLSIYWPNKYFGSETTCPSSHIAQASWEPQGSNRTGYSMLLFSAIRKNEQFFKSLQGWSPWFSSFPTFYIDKRFQWRWCPKPHKEGTSRC